jgi:type III secretion system low calcium response chaperone LcrH/SycD
MAAPVFETDSEPLVESDVEKFYAYAYAHYTSGNWSEAADVFRLLCTRRPLEAKFWFGLGATLQESSSYNDALHAWAMCALLKKEDPYPHFHAAECYFSLEQEKEAQKALSEAGSRVSEMDPLQEKIAILKEQWKV